MDCSSSASRIRVGRSAIGLLCGRLADRAPAPPTTLGTMLDLRLYRLTLLPLAVGLMIVAFSLHAGPAPLSGTLATQGFDAPAAAKTLDGLVAAGEPGSSPDTALAQQLSAAHGGFRQIGLNVRVAPVRAQTAVGARTLDVVIATALGQRPGAIAVLADRANSAATALLVELA